METFYIILVGMLLILAVFDLFNGVSNDAVNFLNSAIGSKAFKLPTLMVFAAIGVFFGATFSNGMMDIPRHGIFIPEYYTFAELMCVFIAVMLTDVILLDIFNSLGMPTSTTVSMIFELLGASTAIAFIKLFSTTDATLSFGDLINTSKALSVIMGIFVSVAIAFTVGTIVQYLTRFVFTFGYKKNMKYFIGVFGSVSLTSIFYFILVKGLKNMSIVSSDFRDFISLNEGMILAVMFIGFFLLSHLLHAIRVNVLKVIIGFGTFSLALAFAGNDLVNFVGVPLTGLSSLQHLLQDGGTAETYTMEALMKSEPGQWYLLMIAGVIMVISLVTSKKAKNVVKTSVSLASQNSSEEIFGTNPVARALVRGTRNAIKGISGIIPERFSRKIDERFDTRQISIEKDADFDLLRAAVNLMLASSLIAFGTSLKLPLSTTYVTFMVAMGTSLADRAWSRETAVYRITGVLSVIGGWFATAFAAFACALTVATILHFGGMPVIFILFALVIFVLIRSFLKASDEKKSASEERFERIMNASPETKVYPLIQEYNRGEWSEILEWSADIYRQIIEGLLREDLGILRTVDKQIKIIKKHSDRIRRHGPICSEKLRQEDLVMKNFFLYQTNDFIVDVLSSLRQIETPCRHYIDNDFPSLVNDKRKKLLRCARDVSVEIEKTAVMVAEGSFAEYDSIRKRILDLRTAVQADRKQKMLNPDNTNVRGEVLYLTLLYETWALLDSVASVAKASRKFLTEKPQ